MENVWSGESANGEGPGGLHLVHNMDNRKGKPEKLGKRRRVVGSARINGPVTAKVRLMGGALVHGAWIASLRPCPKVPRNVPVTSFMGAESVGAVVPAAERTTCVCSTSWWERREKVHAIAGIWLVQ